jgi:hypothetical protein
MKNNRQAFVVGAIQSSPFSRQALAVVLASIGLTACSGALAAPSHQQAKRPPAKHLSSKQESKAAAASLMAPPMKASLDESIPTANVRMQRSPSVAPTIENNKTRSRRFLKEGARLHRMGEYADAERLFKEAVALDPRNPDAFFNLGALSEGRGDLVDALSQYRSGLHLMPNDKALKEAVASMESRLAAGQGHVASRHSSELYANSARGESGYGGSRGENSVEEESDPYGSSALREADRYGRFRTPANMFTNPNPTVGFSDPPVLGVAAPNIPQVPQFSDPPPILPADSNGPFQLSSTQNTALGSGGSYGNPGTYNVLNSSVPPTLQVSQPSGNGAGRRVAGATLNAALRVGMRAALSGTGLHCPACRWLRF